MRTDKPLLFIRVNPYESVADFLGRLRNNQATANFSRRG
jgi:hypothetical protein